MANLVLVHGAMHGGWCWRRLVPALTAAGHRVVTPTLTGMGERRHLLTPDVGVMTHVDDLLGMLRYEDLDDVMVVAHSYGGVVATALVEQAPDTVAALVYLAAFVPRHGESLLEIEPPATQAFYRNWADERGDGWRLVPSEAFLDQWGVFEPADRSWVLSHLTDFPMRCLTDRVALRSNAAARVPRAYIALTSPPLSSLAPFEQRAREEAWIWRELAAGHDAMVTAPIECASVLADTLAEARAPA